MRLRNFVCLGLGCLFAATQTGCCSWEQFRANHPRLYGTKPSDPLVDRSVPPNYPNYPIVPLPGTTQPGGPEILTPQPAPPGSTPTPPPPNSAGYGTVAPPNGIAPAEFVYPPNPTPKPSDSLSIPSGQSAEPPKAPARRMPPPDYPPTEAEKTNTYAVPPGLLDPMPDSKTPLIPPTNVDSSPALPVGIPNFTEISDKLAMGLKPDPEGFQWLRDNGYQTVLHLCRPGADRSAHQEQIEKRSLKYLSLELSAATLTKEQLEEFNKIVADPTNKSLFVYDENGALTGAIWYLHLRSVKTMPAEMAKGHAERLGFREKGTDEQDALWASIQLILDDKKP
jgi:protein tyrosine phosphatase (PTP) superfamily phosphohydrolase (DUF442 family)